MQDAKIKKINKPLSGFITEPKIQNKNNVSKVIFIFLRH
jgi:hypothetical protein